jgi:hypothetical protein
LVVGSIQIGGFKKLDFTFDSGSWLFDYGSFDSKQSSGQGKGKGSKKLR